MFCVEVELFFCHILTFSPQEPSDSCRQQEHTSGAGGWRRGCWGNQLDDDTEDIGTIDDDTEDIGTTDDDTEDEGSADDSSLNDNTDVSNYDATFDNNDNTEDECIGTTDK